MTIKVTDLILIAIVLANVAFAWFNYIVLGNTGLPF